MNSKTTPAAGTCTCEPPCSVAKKRFTLEQIKRWRYDAHMAGEPCTLWDFYNAHGIPHGVPHTQPRTPNASLPGGGAARRKAKGGNMQTKWVTVKRGDGKIVGRILLVWCESIKKWCSLEGVTQWKSAPVRCWSWLPPTRPA